MIFSVVVLPHPLGPMTLVSSPRGHVEADAVQGAHAAGELLRDVGDADRGPAAVLAPARRRARR